ncbi:MAG: sigma-54-dependent transcriptional regulator [Candidatus Binatia bacterium]
MNVLLVEDDNSHAELIQKSLQQRREMNVVRAANAHRALSLLDGRPIHVVVLDYSLPDRDGLDVLQDIRRRDASLPVIFLTSADSAEVCAKALKAGAVEYIVKKRNYLETLPGIVLDACPPPLPAPGSRDSSATLIVGESDAIARLRTAVVRAAGSNATVLIEGETGTGKELVAEAIHAASARAKGPFVAVNCAEIAETLFESELFGHVRGSFTGALTDRKGLLESAGGGTLLLDEVEDLPAGPQIKLLRVLQSREFKPVGASRFLRLDARIIAASNQDLERLVEEGRFRSDLYFRLDVLRIRAPALRERRDDVARLAQHFVQRYNQRNGTRFRPLSPDALDLLRQRQWPGNVRELENLIERTLVNSSADQIDEASLRAGSARNGVDDERERIVEALRRNRWSREKTAAALGISRVTLWRRMSRYGLYS